MKPRSSVRSATRSCTASELPTKSVGTTAGKRALNLPISCGSTYSPIVMLAPISSGPAAWPLISLQARVELGGQREDALGVLERDLARGRERDAPLRAVEEARAQVLFELLDLEGDRRLGHEQRLGRLGEGQVLRDGMEYLEAPVGHQLFKHKTGSLFLLLRLRPGRPAGLAPLAEPALEVQHIGHPHLPQRGGGERCPPVRLAVEDEGLVVRENRLVVRARPDPPRTRASRAARGTRPESSLRARARARRGCPRTRCSRRPRASSPP